MQVVANLQRQPVLPWRQLHLDDVLAIAEVHPWRRSGNGCSGRKAVRVNGDVMMADVRPAFSHGACGDGGYLKILSAEFKHDRALHRCAVLRLNEEHSRTCRFRLAARREHRRQQRQ